MKSNMASLWLPALLVLAGCPSPPEETPRLSAVSVSCVPSSVVAGEPSRCTADATDQDGKPFTVSGFTWASSDESVAKVDATGHVTTFAAGAATLSASATADGVTQQGQASLTVNPQPPRLSAVTVTCESTSVPAGQPSQCTASATDQYDQPFAVSGFTWTSSDESVARVGSMGRVTTFFTGTATLRASATSDGTTHQGQASLTVTEAQPTLHTTPITANETWRATDNPHVVRGSIELGGATSPTLTLEEGVQLRFDLDAELRVTTGALRALGTQEAPIHMMANQHVSTKGYWRGIVFVGGESASEMNHVTLSSCGRNTGESACIALNTLAAPVLRHVTVQDSSTAGIAVADDGSAFGAGSTTLSVSRSDGHAVRMGANQAGTLPTGGTFTDNAPNAVELRGHVSRSQAWPNLGIPYLVGAELHVRDTAVPPTLTLAAGTVLRFGPGASLRIGFVEEEAGGGGLVVDGTADSPVLFTADSANPQPGHWKGVHILNRLSSANRISHATLEYAGAGGSSFGVGAGNLNVYGIRFDDEVPTGVLLSSVVAQKGSHEGICLSFEGYLHSGSSGLTVRDNGGYAISASPETVGTIPTTITLGGNAREAVELIWGVVFRSQTWPNLGIPYVVRENVEVEAGLTLLPGTEIRFVTGRSFLVGHQYPGALISLGTAEAPIRFVPDSATPTQGSWGGLSFWNAGGSRLDHVVVTHGGRRGEFSVSGNLNVYRELGAFVTNSTFSDSDGCGVTRSDGSRTGTTPVTTDFTLAAYNNTFSNNTGGAQCTQ